MKACSVAVMIKEQSHKPNMESSTKSELSSPPVPPAALIAAQQAMENDGDDNDLTQRDLDSKRSGGGTLSSILGELGKIKKMKDEDEVDVAGKIDIDDSDEIVDLSEALSKIGTTFEKNLLIKLLQCYFNISQSKDHSNSSSTSGKSSSDGSTPANISSSNGVGLDTSDDELIFYALCCLRARRYRLARALSLLNGYMSWRKEFAIRADSSDAAIQIKCIHDILSSGLINYVEKGRCLDGTGILVSYLFPYQFRL